MKKLNQLSQLEEFGLARISIEKIRGRELISSEKSYLEYCSTNYLGFDYSEHMAKKSDTFTREWGSLYGLSRLEVEPKLYTHLEKRIAHFLGVKDVILSHTITLTNLSVMSSIAKKGIIFCDQKVHHVVYESARLARDHGAKIVSFLHQDLSSLEQELIKAKDIFPKVIAVDGVYSVSSERAPIKELQDLCEKYEAWLYVDDAHGFGVYGRSPSLENPYGVDGSGVVHYYGGNFRRTFYVSSFGKAFCTHGAFITIPDLFEEPLRSFCTQYIYSAPISPAVVGLIEGAMDENEKIGSAIRIKLFEKTKRFVTGMRSIGLLIQNVDEFPVVYWKIGNVEQLIEVAKELYSRGIIAGLRAFPVVPVNECGMRFGITDLHTNEQIDYTIKTIEEVLSATSLKKTA